MRRRHSMQRHRCCALPSRIGGDRMSLPRLAAVAVTLAMLSGTELAHAQLLLSTNDNKVALVNGVATVVKSPPPDTLTVIDIKSWPPKVVAELDVPGSVVGPPFSVALTRARPGSSRHSRPARTPPASRSTAPAPWHSSPTA